MFSSVNENQFTVNKEIDLYQINYIIELLKFLKIKNIYFKPGRFFGSHVVSGLGQGSAAFVDALFPGSHFPGLVGGGVLAISENKR